ncbi:hypothetical protein KXV28_003703 [Aspergillus fumigatus]|nr:hypothetical protein KXV28_003703 [Aspergillus fumigatus]
MALLDLPNETLLSIAQSLDGARDISSFARVTKRTYRLLLSTLYNFNGRPLMVEKMLDQYLFDVNAIYLSNTPLVYAVIHGSTVVVDVLLARRHINVNFQNKKGECALWWAAYLGHTDILERLLQRDDIEVDTADQENGLTPLSVAVMRRHEGIVQHLLGTRRVNVNARDKRGRPLIFHAISRDDRRMLEILLGDRNLDMSCQGGRGRTPLLYSVSKGQTELTKVLLGHPRSFVDVRDRKDRTPLWHAVRLGNEQIVEVLLRNGADSNVPDIEMVTPFHKSIMKGKLSTLQMLLKRLPPQPFCRSEMVQLLLDHGWNVNEEDAEELTPLLLAAKEGYSSVVQVLLNHPQINLHAQDHCGSTALHAAAKEGHLEVVKLLLTEGSIDVNVKDKDGVTPLWWATQNRHDELAALLLAEPNVDVNTVNQLERPFPDRSTSLHHAVQARDVRIMRLLLTKEDLDPNVADHQKWTPLCWAASQGDVEMVDLLLTRPEIRINGVEGEEVPPLCLAAREGHTQVVRRLLQYPGIDMDQGWGAYSILLTSFLRPHSKRS